MQYSSACCWGYIRHHQALVLFLFFKSEKKFYKSFLESEIARLVPTTTRQWLTDQKYLKPIQTADGINNSGIITQAYYEKCNKKNA